MDSLQKLTQFSQGNNVLDAAHSNIHGFLFRDTCVSSPSKLAYLGQNEPFDTLKTIICRNYSFPKLTQFLQGNNARDAPDSNTDVFL
jgi:hypothetical protein